MWGTGLEGKGRHQVKSQVTVKPKDGSLQMIMLTLSIFLSRVKVCWCLHPPTPCPSIIGSGLALGSDFQPLCFLRALMKGVYDSWCGDGPRARAHGSGKGWDTASLTATLRKAQRSTSPLETLLQVLFFQWSSPSILWANNSSLSFRPLLQQGRPLLAGTVRPSAVIKGHGPFTLKGVIYSGDLKWWL